MSSKPLLSLFTWVSINNVFHLEQRFSPSITDILQCYSCVSNLVHTFQTDWVDSSTQSILFIHKSCSIDYSVSYHPSCTSTLSQLSSLTKIYFILGFKSFSPIFLVAMSANLRPLSHQSTFCIFHFFTIPYKIHSSINVNCVFGILTILSHTKSRFSIQYNYRRFL